MAEDLPAGGGSSRALRIVVFGVTGQVGQELVDRLDDGDWPIAELVGVASGDSHGESFEFRGDRLDVSAEWPVLKGTDLVFVCTRGAEALEIVRECLRASVPCVDLTGALAGQEEVPLPVVLGSAVDDGDPLNQAPLIAVPSSTTLAWAPVITALSQAVEVTRVVATVLCSAAAHGRGGVASLSEESIALFNQSAHPDPGPAGQAIAFDVVPGGGVYVERVRGELARVFGDALRADLASVQIPTFVGEGASLAVELARPLERSVLEARLGAQDGLAVIAEGPGSRGLVAVEEGSPEPLGPTLRDAVGVDEVLVGRIEADASAEPGQGWRLWLAYDPLRLAADHAIRIARRRLGLG